MNARFINYLGKKYHFDPIVEWRAYRNMPPEEKGQIMKEEADSILLEVSLLVGMNISTIKSVSRKREIVYVRHALTKIYYDRNMGSLKTIGSFTSIGGRGRDHATVLHSISIANDLIQTNDTVFMSIWEKIKHLNKR